MTKAEWPPKAVVALPDPSRVEDGRPGAGKIATVGGASTKGASPQVVDTTAGTDGTLFAHATFNPRDPTQALKPGVADTAILAEMGSQIGKLAFDPALLTPATRATLAAACRHPTGDEAMCAAISDGLAPFDYALKKETADRVLTAAKDDGYGWTDDLLGRLWA